MNSSGTLGVAVTIGADGKADEDASTAERGDLERDRKAVSEKTIGVP